MKCDALMWSKHSDRYAMIVATDDALSAAEVALARLRCVEMWRSGGMRSEASDELTRGLTGSRELPAWVWAAAYPEAL